MADPATIVRKALSIAISLHGSAAEHDRNQAAVAIERAEALIVKHGLKRSDFTFPGEKAKPSPGADRGHAETRHRTRPRNPFYDAFGGKGAEWFNMSEEEFDEFFRDVMRKTSGARGFDFGTGGRASHAGDAFAYGMAGSERVRPHGDRGRENRPKNPVDDARMRMREWRDLSEPQRSFFRFFPDAEITRNEGGYRWVLREGKLGIDIDDRQIHMMRSASDTERLIYDFRREIDQKAGMGIVHRHAVNRFRDYLSTPGSYGPESHAEEEWMIEEFGHEYRREFYAQRREPFYEYDTGPRPRSRARGKTADRVFTDDLDDDAPPTEQQRKASQAWYGFDPASGPDMFNCRCTIDPKTAEKMADVERKIRENITKGMNIPPDLLYPGGPKGTDKS